MTHCVKFERLVFSFFVARETLADEQGHDALRHCLQERCQDFFVAGVFFCGFFSIRALHWTPDQHSTGANGALGDFMNPYSHLVAEIWEIAEEIEYGPDSLSRKQALTEYIYWSTIRDDLNNRQRNVRLEPNCVGYLLWPQDYGNPRVIMAAWRRRHRRENPESA